MKTIYMIRFSGAMMEIYRGCPEDLTDITEAPEYATTTGIITFVPDIEPDIEE